MYSSLGTLGSHVTGHRRGVTNRTLIILVVVLLGGGLLVCGICGGVSWFGWRFTTQMLGEQLKTALQENPVAREHLGDIQSCELNLTQTGQVTQESGGRQQFVFDVVGSEGSGTVTAEQNPSNPQQQMMPIELRLSDGSSYDLSAADPPAADDGAGAGEP